MKRAPVPWSVSHMAPDSSILLTCQFACALSGEPNSPAELRMTATVSIEPTTVNSPLGPMRRLDCRMSLLPVALVPPRTRPQSRGDTKRKNREIRIGSVSPVNPRREYAEAIPPATNPEAYSTVIDSNWLPRCTRFLTPIARPTTETTSYTAILPYLNVNNSTVWMC